MSLLLINKCDLGYIKFGTIEYDRKFIPTLNDWIIVSHKQLELLSKLKNAEVYQDEHGNTFVLFQSIPFKEYNDESDENCLS